MKDIFLHPSTKLAVDIVRTISKGAFRRRFTLDEKVDIKVSNDPVVKVLEEDLLATSSVDLDFQPLIEGLEYLVSVGILTAERKAELLQDGAQGEQV